MGYDLGMYSHPSLDPYRQLANIYHNDAGNFLLEEELGRRGDRRVGQLVYRVDQAPQTLIPLNHLPEIKSVYVNPKQYDAIMRRRFKKINKLRALGAHGVKIKKKVKYDSRSKHARNRKRAKDGKFLSAPNDQDARTVSTFLRAQDEDQETEQEVRVPCYAEEAEERKRKTEEDDEKETKVKLEIDEMDNMSINSDDFMGGFTSGMKRPSRRDNMSRTVFDEEPSLRHHDSLFDSKR